MRNWNCSQKKTKPGNRQLPSPKIQKQPPNTTSISDFNDLREINQNLEMTVTKKLALLCLDEQQSVQNVNLEIKEVELSVDQSESGAN